MNSADIQEARIQGLNPGAGWSKSMHRPKSYEGRLKISWTGGSAPLLCRGRRCYATL